MDYTTDATTINYTETDYSSSSTSSTSYSSSSNNGSVNNAANETAIANITVEKEEEASIEIIESQADLTVKEPEVIDPKTEKLKKIEELHKEFVSKLPSERVAKSRKEELEQKRRQINRLYEPALILYENWKEAPVNLTKPQIENRIALGLLGYAIEEKIRKVVAKLAMRTAEFTFQELNLVKEQLSNCSLEAGYALLKLSKKFIIQGIYKFKKEEFTPTAKKDIDEYREEVDPTKIPAENHCNDIVNKYETLIKNASKNSIEPKTISDIIASIRQTKEEELEEKGQLKAGTILPVNCGEVIVKLVEKYPKHAEKLKKLCPDIYKAKNKIKEELKKEIARRQQLEIEVAELKKKGEKASLFQEFMLKDEDQNAAFQAFLKQKAC